MANPTFKRAKPSPSSARSNIVVWGVLSVTVGVVLARLVGHVAAELPSLFQGFGVDVPAYTTFALNWWYGLWAMPVFAAAVWVIAMLRPPGDRRRTAATLKLSLWTSITLGVLALLALYAGAFSMGAPV